MPTVYVDISIHSEEDAVGMVSGPLEVVATPRVGEALSFGVPAQCVATVEERGIPFIGDLMATAVLPPSAGSDQDLVMLETLVGRTRADALQLIAFFEQQHNLFPDVWDRAS